MEEAVVVVPVTHETVTAPLTEAGVYDRAAGIQFRLQHVVPILQRVLIPVHPLHVRTVAEVRLHGVLRIVVRGGAV